MIGPHCSEVQKNARENSQSHPLTRPIMTLRVVVSSKTDHFPNRMANPSPSAALSYENAIAIESVLCESEKNPSQPAALRLNWLGCHRGAVVPAVTEPAATPERVAAGVIVRVGPAGFLQQPGRCFRRSRTAKRSRNLAPIGTTQSIEPCGVTRLSRYSPATHLDPVACQELRR